MPGPGLPDLPTEPGTPEEIALRADMQVWRTTNRDALADLDDKIAAFRTKLRTTKDSVTTEVTELKAAVDMVAAISKE